MPHCRQALILAALDGGHLRQIMRAALLELGSLYMACALPRLGTPRDQGCTRNGSELKQALHKCLSGLPHPSLLC
eukprot:1158066-Pelagomonas_calceolata.AAC.12